MKGKILMKVYIDFDDVLCETAKHFTKLAKELFGIDVPYREVQFFNLKKTFDLSDEQYEEMMIAGHLPENLLNYEETTGAADTIIKGIRYFEKTDVDTIIIGRGGGSIEDLWAFNEPEVVEAVFNASTPVISAVGHETDFTLTDFVADMRAPTPSAAAELAVTEVAAVENRIYEYERRLKQQMMYSLSAKRDYLERLKLQMEYLNPVNQIYDKRQRLMNMEDKLNMLIKRCAAENRNRLRLYASKLDGLSPLRKLDMGYGYIENSEGNRIVSAGQVSSDDEITVYLKDGSIRSKVIEVGEAWQKH